ncbi:hypothetical protein [Streptomyces massasporeus]|uniref:hypothetical protein n=1 Tax=Streptomyces massasporeus TaxID=67324 RepID=UPI0034038110
MVDDVRIILGLRAEVVGRACRRRPSGAGGYRDPARVHGPPQYLLHTSGKTGVLMRAAPDADNGQSRVVVGLLVDPDAPAELAEKLAEDLPELLAEAVNRDSEWSLRVVRDPLTATLNDSVAILNATREHKLRENWDIAVCLTDLPLRTGGRPLVVDVDAVDRVALVSLPALGGIFLRRRLRRSVVRLLKDLMLTPTGDGSTRPGQGTIGPIVSERAAPVQRVPTDEEIVDLRIVGSPARGRLRLLLGMVRANGPWRLVPALAKALATALATSAIAVMNVTLWNIATGIRAERLAVLALFSVAAMVTWLIVHRRLWERPDSLSALDREKAALYNASTVLTLFLGVLCGLVGLYVVDFAVSLFLIDRAVLAKQVGRSVGLGDYARLASLASAAAIVGGALGSESESDEAVRRAAYGKRERQHREQAERERREADTAQSG